MKITRERLEEILREEIASITEVWGKTRNPFGKPSGKVHPEQPNPWEKAEKGELANTGTYTPPKRPPVPMTPKSPDEHLRDIEDGSVGYDARNRPVEEGHMGGDVPLSVLAAGGEKARKDVRATYKQGSRKFELAMMVIAMAEKQGMIAEGMPPELMNGGTPPIENDQRARELLNGFKKMLRPEEKAEPSACATFLRQLADMVEREGGTPDAGTMPKPLPNN